MLFEEVFRKLNKYRVKYLVIGGIAANLQGFSRLTMDLDIMLEPERDNVDVFLKNPMGFDRAYKNHEIREINGTRVHVACIDDLIELKELSGREKDWRDIGYLKLAKKIAQETDEKE